MEFFGLNLLLILVFFFTFLDGNIFIARRRYGDNGPGAEALRFLGTLFRYRKKPVDQGLPCSVPARPRQVDFLPYEIVDRCSGFPGGGCIHAPGSHWGKDFSAPW